MNFPSFDQLCAIVAKLSTKINNLESTAVRSIKMGGNELVNEGEAVIPSAEVTISDVSTDNSIETDADGKIVPLADDGGFLPVGEVNKIIVAFNNLVDRVNSLEA
jgi:hypothetical protein